MSDERVDRVRELHQTCFLEGDGTVDYCSHCTDLCDRWIQYPCPTIRALDRTDQEGRAS